MKKYISILIVATIFLNILISSAQAEEIRVITFPVDGTVTYSDDFDDVRSGGRTHNATDMLGVKMTPLVSAVDGVVTYLPETEPSWGWGVWIKDSDGYEYVYLHINNDTPGTDDGQGGINWAFAPAVRQGAQVTKGQFIGYMGDSGNAESVGSHLHFEIHRPDDTPINPYFSLQAAQGLISSTPINYNRADILSGITSINQEKNLYPNPNASCESGTLIKTKSNTAVYYCGADGKRYVFPEQKVYNSWYKDFTGVKTIDESVMEQISFGGNVTYKPGTRLIKAETIPKIYAIDAFGTLRWITSPQTAVSIFGDNWESLISEVGIIYFSNYAQGQNL